MTEPAVGTVSQLITDLAAAAEMGSVAYKRVARIKSLELATQLYARQNSMNSGSYVTSAAQSFYYFLVADKGTEELV